MNYRENMDADKERWKNERHLWRIPQYRIIHLKRICERYRNKNRILYCLFWMIYHHYEIKYNIDIPVQAKIGPGFRIRHIGGIVFNPHVEIGQMVDILNGVMIGQEDRGIRKGVPKIGNRVFIGTNAIIVGKIIIGNNVLIAPGAFVNFDVPDNSIVIGNPGKIIHSLTATDGYLD